MSQAAPAEVTAQQLAAVLRNWVPEPEWATEPPRALPPEIRDGPYMRSREQSVRWSFAMSAFAFVLARCAEWTEWARFVPMFRYFDWPALVLATFGIAFFLRNRLLPGNLNYFVYGIPVPVLAVGCEWTQRPVDEHHFYWRYHLHCLRAGPDGVPEPVTFRSREIISLEVGALENHFVESELEVVTAIRLPNGREDALQIYGLLELREGIGLHPKPVLAGQFSLILAILSALMFDLLFYFIYPLQVRSGWEFLVPPLIMGVLSSIFVRLVILPSRAAGAMFRVGSDRVELADHICLYCVCVLLSIGPSMAANRWFDFAPTAKCEARLRQADSFEFFGVCGVDYLFDGPSGVEIHRVPWDECGDGFTDRAELEIAPGLFGSPWVKSVRWLPPVDEGPAEAVRDDRMRVG